MARRTREKILATEAQKLPFLEMIDRRISEFLAVVLASDAEAEVLRDVEKWAEHTRLELRSSFSEWYAANTEGTKIFKDLLIRAPSTSSLSKRFGKLFTDSCCEVCGDTRVLNVAHIIPRFRGGPDEEWNLMRLCANHHYLFDSGRLTEDEWNSIDWDSKDSRVQEYISGAGSVAQRHYWESLR